MIELVVAALAGLLTGRVVRRATPWLLGARAPAALPFRRPWPELLGAFAFLWIVARTQPASTAPALALATLLLAVTAADLHSKLIPDRLTFPGTALGIGLAAWRPQAIADLLGQWRLLAELDLPFLGALAGTSPTALGGVALSLAGALLGFLALEAFRRLMAAATGVEGMGMGDAKLLMAIGAFLGPYGAALALLPACAAGALIGIVQRLRTGLPHAPFGPALAFGALAVATEGERLLAALWRASLAVFTLPLPLIVAIYASLLALLVVLLLRLRRRAGHYSEILEEDYRAIEAELRGEEEQSDPPPV